jgi:hypothetical protein
MVDKNNTRLSTLVKFAQNNVPLIIWETNHLVVNLSEVDNQKIIIDTGSHLARETWLSKPAEKTCRRNQTKKSKQRALKKCV